MTERDRRRVVAISDLDIKGIEHRPAMAVIGGYLHRQRPHVGIQRAGCLETIQGPHGHEQLGIPKAVRGPVSRTANPPPQYSLNIL